MMIEQRIYNGDQARLVLENEAFAAAFADLKQEITEQWQTSPARDHEGREKLYQLRKLADKLELILRSSLDDGTLAKVELQRLQNRQSPLQRAASAIGWT